MSISPEYGDEERLLSEESQLREKAEGIILPEDREEAPEREIAEHEREERELFYVDAESNEAHAPAGQICERCGQAIGADQDARLRASGGWVHEVCPTKP
jgi:hypothetical protein